MLFFGGFTFWGTTILAVSKKGGNSLAVKDAGWVCVAGRYHQTFFSCEAAATTKFGTFLSMLSDRNVLFQSPSEHTAVHWKRGFSYIVFAVLLAIIWDLSYTTACFYIPTAAETYPSSS